MGTEDQSIGLPSHYEDHRGRTFPIFFKKSGMDISGENDNGRITINASRSLHWQARTLFHELLHQSLDFMVFPDPERGLEEVIVTTIDENIGLIWERNPALFEWLHRNMTNGTTSN